ncbi:MAG: diguanylate cyclase [Actinomycetota bacterium]|nr:diguanylate cyclase [Actinomycetota bacterium]
MNPGFGTTLALLSLLVLVSTIAAGIMGIHSVTQVQSAEKNRAHLEDVDTQVVTLRGLNQALLGRVMRRYITRAAPVTKTPYDAQQLQQITLSLQFSDASVGLRILGTDEFSYSEQGVKLLASATLTKDEVEGFSALAGALDERASQQHELLRASRDQAEAEQARILQEALWRQVMVSTVVAGLLFAVGWGIRFRLVRSLHRLALVAGTVAEGDLSARTGSVSNDEIGHLGQVLDRMAETLQNAFADLDREAARQDYTARVSRALEYVDEESDLAETVSQSLSVTAPALPAELLLSDSSEAHLERIAWNPLVPAPGCPVTLPWSCPALRSGRTTVFPSSAVIDTCPRLRQRPEGERAGTCIPVTFMGQMLGVLHIATAPRDLPDEALRGRLETLAELFGTRVGNIRAFEKVQLQASLDGLTGLPNRRTFEDSVQKLALTGEKYGLLMADLDRFKTVNDTYGHAAGDRALRVFADVLRTGLRPEDLPCRYGGEEFAIALPGLTAQEAAESADRLRQLLAEVLSSGGKGPAFTVSLGASDSTMGAILPDQLAVADDALLAAKRGGRDRCIIGSPSGLVLGPMVHGREPAEDDRLDVGEFRDRSGAFSGGITPLEALLLARFSEPQERRARGGGRRVRPFSDLPAAPDVPDLPPATDIPDVLADDDVPRHEDAPRTGESLVPRQAAHREAIPGRSGHDASESSL